MSNITFEFACRDDCLDRMIPSDLRKLVVERDALKAEIGASNTEIERLRGMYEMQQRDNTRLVGSAAELGARVEQQTKEIDRLSALVKSAFIEGYRVGRSVDDPRMYSKTFIYAKYDWAISESREALEGK